MLFLFAPAILRKSKAAATPLPQNLFSRYDVRTLFMQGGRNRTRWVGGQVTVFGQVISRGASCSFLRGQRSAFLIMETCQTTQCQRYKGTP